MQDWQFRFIMRSFEHQHNLLHEILSEVTHADPAKLAAITAKLKGSADALSAAVAAVPTQP